VILENYLPDEFGVSQNVFLIDTEGTTSDECDLVIYRKNAMKNIVHNDIQYIPVENAMYVVEVKSHSDLAEIAKTVKSAQKLKALRKSPHIQSLGNLVSCYFAYSSNLKTEHSEFKRYIEVSGGFGPSPSIEVLCEINQGYYYFGIQSDPRFGVTNYSWSSVNSSRELNVKLFLIGVLNTLNRSQPIGYYASGPGSIKFLYYRNLVEDFEISVENHEHYLRSIILFEENKPNECIQVTESLFAPVIANRILYSFWKHLHLEGNLGQAQVYLTHLLGKTVLEPKIRNHVAKFT